MGLAPHELDRFLTLFDALRERYEQKRPDAAGSGDYWRTIARALDAITYRLTPPSRRRAIRVYLRALRREPRLAAHLSWSRFVASAVLGGRAPPGARVRAGCAVMLRAVAKAVIPANARYLLRVQAAQVRQHGLGWAWQWNRMLTDAYIRERLNRRHYHELDEASLRARRSFRYRLHLRLGLLPERVERSEWRHFAAHDVFGFNMFIYERWVPIRFQLLRGGAEGQLAWRSYGEHIAETIRDNPHCRDTAFLLQGEYQAQFCNQMVGYRMLPAGPADLSLPYRARRWTTDPIV